MTVEMVCIITKQLKNVRYAIQRVLIVTQGTKSMPVSNVMKPENWLIINASVKMDIMKIQRKFVNFVSERATPVQ